MPGRSPESSSAVGVWVGSKIKTPIAEVDVPSARHNWWRAIQNKMKHLILHFSKKDLAAIFLGVSFEIIQNKMVTEWGPAILIGACGWTGGKIAELIWNACTKKNKTNGSN